jgi:PiT family inorganic phosphate transporter
MLVFAIIIISLSVKFDFLNGVYDSSNIVATMISSLAFRPAMALGITAIAEFLGPFIFGVAVANTIGQDIVNSSTITVEVLIAALIGAILWNIMNWFLDIPSSSSHALVGGLMGAVIFGFGTSVVPFQG